MQLVHLGPQRALHHLRALVAVGRDGAHGLAQPHRALLGALQELVFETDHDVDELAPIRAAELADHASDVAEARQLVRLAVVMSLAEGPPTAAQMARLREYAGALGVDEPAVGVIEHLSRGRMRRFRLAFLRRSHLRHYLKKSLREAGSFVTLIRWGLIFRGVLPNDERIAARFRALGQLPEDSLGHRFLAHCDREGLPVPGEQGGFPSGAIYHDFAHVLAGYDTSPEGEMKAAAFQAGFTRGEHDFFTWLFSILLHTTGVNLSPFEFEMRPGRIGEGRLARDVLVALRRGAQMKVDLGADWDLWNWVELPIPIARERLGVAPVDAFAAPRA